jgi:hypothetical protein
VPLPGASRYAVTRATTAGPILMVAKGSMLLANGPFWRKGGTMGQVCESLGTNGPGALYELEETEIPLNAMFTAPIRSVGY